MQFHLNYKPAVSLKKIIHEDHVLLIGSCFSENIGLKLSDHKFKVDSNPFGIVFNPSSIAKGINRIVNKNYFTDRDVLQYDGKWISFESHSSISASTKEEILNTLNGIIDTWHEKIKSAKWLVITFGSAYAYRHSAQNIIVSNCHKLPQSLFEKQLLEPTDIVSEQSALLKILHQFNAELNVLYTVSPVKHLRDGVVENSLSKSILIQSVHQLVKDNKNCVYFPAYEIVSDDLRDYRFYESDMAHPNKQAIDYVWKRFSEVYFNEVTCSINERVMQIQQAFNHRLFDQLSPTSIKFKKGFYEKCLALQLEYPWLNLKKELQYFNIYEN
ncbi:MAG: GSCFA domain-containing protein [Burkholderiales bacterium]|nr:GSCFA domain-containing protein [Bacteroidia bacterium]